MREDPMTISLRRPVPREEAPVPPRDVEPPRPPNIRSRRGRSQRLAGLFFFILLAVGAGTYWYFKSDEKASDSPAPQTEENAALETEDLIRRVGMLIVLPEGEEPTIATVTDPEKLKGQSFFARAKVGDKVLIYTQARKAYLFDPRENILLEVAPLTAEISP